MLWLFIYQISSWIILLIFAKLRFKISRNVTIPQLKAAIWISDEASELVKEEFILLKGEEIKGITSNQNEQ